MEAPLNVFVAIFTFETNHPTNIFAAMVTNASPLALYLMLLTRMDAMALAILRSPSWRSRPIDQYICPMALEKSGCSLLGLVRMRTNALHVQPPRSSGTWWGQSSQTEPLNRMTCWLGGPCRPHPIRPRFVSCPPPHPLSRLLSIALHFEHPWMRAWERGTSVCIGMPRKHTVNSLWDLRFVFRGFAWRVNYHARFTLTRTHSRAFEVKRNRQYCRLRFMNACA